MFSFYGLFLPDDAARVFAPGEKKLFPRLMRLESNKNRGAHCHPGTG